MKLIVGLGNPGDKYKFNRHNIGFLIVEKITEDREAVFKLDDNDEAMTTEIEELNEKAKMILPQTFMNESGRAVIKIKQYYKIEKDDIWVIHDDVDLEPGKIKIQFGGSSAGHHGIESITNNIGDKFWRIRIGVGRSENIPTDKWVLQDFDNREELDKIIDKAQECVVKFLEQGIKEETILV